MRAYFKMQTCISLCGPEVNVNKTHISKVNYVKSPRTFCVCSLANPKHDTNRNISRVTAS